GRDEQIGEAVRAAAVPALADCAGAESLGTLAELQQSSVVSLRAGAALALASLPRRPEVPKRLAAALADAAPAVLAAACHSAGVLRDRASLPRLIELTDHADSDVRREAVSGLAALEVPAAVPKLTRALASDPAA